MTTQQTNKEPLIWLVLATFSVFFGRGMQHFISETPYRAFFWDEYLFGKSGIIAANFALNVFKDDVIDKIGFFVGAYLLLASMIVLGTYIYTKNKSKQTTKFLIPFLYFGSVLLLFLAILYSKDHFFEIPQFLEYTVQWICPILLALYLKYGWTKHLVFLSKIALSFTFACHGIYALGLLPVPVQFMEMTMTIMNIDEAAAHLFLGIAGIMDFIVAILIFFPNHLKRSGLLYMVLWGSLTAIARLVYQIEMFTDFYAILIGLSESMMRFPHFLIPAFLLYKMD